VRLPALQHPSLLETAAALPRVPGFPRLGVLRRLRPVPDRSAVGAPSPIGAAGCGAGGEDRDGSRVHCGSLVEVGARLCPCGIAASTPQTFLAASLAAHAHRLGSSPPSRRRVRTASSPDQPGFELASHKGGVTRRFLAYSSPSRLPDPAHPVVLDRPVVVRAAPTLPGTTRIRLPSAPLSCCDRISGEGLSPPLEPQRLTAHPRPAPHPQDDARRTRRPDCDAGRAARAPPTRAGTVYRHATRRMREEMVDALQGLWEHQLTLGDGARDTDTNG
jgi:hypothetical protein